MRTTQTIPGDIVELERLLTPEDRLEVACSNPGADIVWDLLDNLRKGSSGVVMRSLRAPSGELLLVGGWNATGHVWMLATTHAKDFPVATYRGVLECRTEALKDCPRLYNMAMLTNKMHVKLLKSIGAEFIGPIHGVNGEPFQAFYIE